MEDLLSSPWWESVGVIVGAILAIIAIYLTIRQFKRKRLSYSIVLDSKPVVISSNLKKDLIITYQDKQVSELSLIEIVFTNTGNIAIRSSDFEEYLEIDLPEAKNILSITITKNSPEKLNVNFKKIGTKITIEPLLLNQTDSFGVLVLFDGHSDACVSGRIADVVRIRREKRPNTPRSILLFVTYPALGFSLGLLPYILTELFPYTNVTFIYSSIVIAALSFILPSLSRRGNRLEKM